MLCFASFGLHLFCVYRFCSYMATSGVDRYLKIWDLRNTYRELVRYKLDAAARDLCFSQTQYLAAGVGNTVQVEFLAASLRWFPEWGLLFTCVKFL